MAPVAMGAAWQPQNLRPSVVLVLLVLRLAPGSLVNLLGKTRFPTIALQRTDVCPSLSNAPKLLDMGAPTAV